MKLHLSVDPEERGIHGLIRAQIDLEVVANLEGDRAPKMIHLIRMIEGCPIGGPRINSMMARGLAKAQ